MSKISLHAYNHEVEALIERGHTEEAIAHCKYILKAYPKHLDTYRLLGKAFLESQRYSEAADILTRILSVLPDDFVAQIGMSIIREDEGNLDAAIYHMERAFEIQPANAAIQDELRRLYGRRDGIEPAKLRLTSGALVRMYARGELYRQAIAEARSAIKEDPQRLDLEIVLARMYFQIGQKAEAAEICSRLVMKLPYCMEANRILADVLPDTSRAEDAKIYFQRLVALDPYLAYQKDASLPLSQIPDNAVSLDRLEWIPSIDSAHQPAWASDLGVKVEETNTQQPTPDWLSNLQEKPLGFTDSQPIASSEVDDLLAPQAFAEDLQLQTGMGDDEPNRESLLTADSSHSPAETDLPEWLQNLGDEDPLKTADEPLPDWMINSGWVPSTHLEQEPSSPLETGETMDDSIAAPGEIPDWLKDLAPADSSEAAPESPLPPVAANTADDSSVDNLRGLANDNELPEWLQSPQSQPDELPASPDQEALPDWLMDTSDETEELLPEGDLLKVEPAIDSIEKSRGASIAPSEEPTPTADQALEMGDDVDDAMAWLESLAAKQGADEETLLTKPQDRLETPPQWIVESSADDDSIRSQQILETESAPASAAEPTAQEDRIPSESIQDSPMVESFSVQAPETVTLETTQPEASDLSPETQDDMDQAYAWLESLAAKQGAESEELFIAPEDRLGTPPDWVQHDSVLAGDSVANVDLPATGAHSSSQDENENLPEFAAPPNQPGDAQYPIQAPDAVLTETIDQPAEEISQQEDGKTPLPESVSPDWVRESELDTQAQAQISPDFEEDSFEVRAQQPGEQVESSPMPSWLVDGYHPPVETQEALSPTQEEPSLPDWLVDEIPRTDQPVSQSLAELDGSSPPLPDWLKDLEAEQTLQPLPVDTTIDLGPSASQDIIESSRQPDALLQQAQELLAKGQLEPALEMYTGLIENGLKVEETVHDLRDALYRYPVDSAIWQTLGDAYMRANRVQDALDAFTKAEELLK